MGDTEEILSGRDDASRNRGARAEAVSVWTQARRGWESPDSTKVLERLYRDAPLLLAAGSSYPVAVWPLAEGVRLEAVLQAPKAGAVAGVEGGRACAARSYRDALTARGVPLHDGATVTLRRLVLEAGAVRRIEVDRGSYFAALDSCDALGFELALALGRGALDPRGGAPELLAELPLRAALHAGVADPLRTGGGRSAALAVSTLLVFTARGTRWALLRRRSERGAAGLGGRVHVLPSGMLQPRGDRFELGGSIGRTVLAELLEELYGRAEEAAWRATAPGDGAEGDPALRRLADAGAFVELLGVGVDLTNLRPELLTLLRVPQASWYERGASATASSGLAFAVNAEWGEGVGPPGAPLGAVPLVEDAAEQAGLAPLGPGDMVPAGAAAFWLGRERVFAAHVG